MTDAAPNVEDFYAPGKGRSWGPVKAWMSTVPIGEVVPFPEHISDARRPSGVGYVIKQAAELNGIARSRVKVLNRDDQTWVYIEPEAK